MLHDLKTTAGRDFGRLFAPGERTVLYAPVQWQSRIRTLLEMMASASTEQDYPGPLYLLLILHYVEQECIAESSAVARPHNETVEQICAYLAANYRQKFSLTEVAAQFYLSPYYLSRLFRRVTGQSIVDYINNRRIEAAPEAAGNDRAFHQCGGRADRLCQRRPFPPGVPRGDGYWPTAVPQRT